MKLEDLLGEELWKQVEEKINKANEGEEDKLKHIRYADLSEGGYVSKDKYSSLETDLNGKTSELEAANELIEKLKKESGDDAETQQKIKDYESEIAALKAENESLKIENALKFALKDAGGTDIDYLVFKAKEDSEIKLDEDGKIKGIDDLIAGLKEQHPTQFASSGDGETGRKKIDPNNLPDGNGNDAPITKEKFLQMGYSERLKLKQENPEQYKKFAGN